MDGWMDGWMNTAGPFGGIQAMLIKLGNTKLRGNRPRLTGKNKL